MPKMQDTGGKPPAARTVDQFIEQQLKQIRQRNKIRRSYLYPQVGKIGNHFWYWKCRQHEQLQFAANWATAYQAATHHARNHHKGWPQ